MDINIRTCKKCQRPHSRICKNKKTSHFIDNENKSWYGLVCPKCVPLLRNKTHIEEFKNCKMCNIKYKPKVSHQLYCSYKCLNYNKYINYKKNKKVLKPLTKDLNCKTCNKVYHGKRNSKYCSLDCRPKIKYKQMKRPYKKRQPYRKNCKGCGKEFTGFKNKLYCRENCSPSYLSTKRYRRSIERCKHQKISKTFKDEIKFIYDNRPPGYHVDHIMPLKHKLHCGLHVPWNLQYLPAKENIKKGNKI